MNIGTLNKYLNLSIFLLIFLSIYYVKAPFNYGYGNNVEELPLVCKKLNIANYPNDPFVEGHSERITQITPYVTLIAFIYNLSFSKSFSSIFLIVNILSIAGLYSSIWWIYNSVVKTPDLLIFFFIMGLGFIASHFGIIPNSRSLFYRIADPIPLVYPLVFMTIASYLSGKNIHVFIFLLLSTIIHPLYSLYVYSAIFCCELFRYIFGNTTIFCIIKNNGIYSLAALPYIFILYLLSRQSVATEIDASLILEFIRSPHHHSIPTIGSIPAKFYFYSVANLLLGLFCLKFVTLNVDLSRLKSLVRRLLKHLKLSGDSEECHEPNGESYGKGSIKVSSVNSIERGYYLIFINAILIFTLLVSSLISTFIRIPLLIQLTPYRMGAIIVVLSWIIVTAGIYSKIVNSKECYLTYRPFPLIVIKAIIIILSVTALISGHRIEGKSPLKEQSEVISWIKSETNESDMFLNYSDIPIRTQCFRPSYFEFKTMPLTADMQLGWYKRLLAYYDVPGRIADKSREVEDPRGIKHVKAYIDNMSIVNAKDVASKIAVPPKYLIKCKKAIPKKNELNAVYRYLDVNTEGYRCVYENKLYSVYRIRL